MNDLLKILLDSLEFVVLVAVLATGYFRGRRNERLHLADLEKRERQYRKVLLFATRYPPATAVPLDPLLVSGSVVLAADSFMMFVAGLRKFFGGRFHAYERLIARARREATLRMKEAARAAGSNMIFNVRLETTQINNGPRGGSATVEVLAYGTLFLPAADSVANSPHHFVPGPALPDVEGFDMAKNPASRKLLLALAAGVVFFFVEIFGMQDYAYVGGTPDGLTQGLAILAGVAGLAAGIWLFRRRVPLAESIVMAFLCLLVSGGVGYFLTLHLNDATDLSPVAESVYLLQADKSLHPQQAGLPVLRFPEEHEYWQNQPLNSQHVFVLRRGMLGVWQFNQTLYVEKLRVYFDRHPS